MKLFEKIANAHLLLLRKGNNYREFLGILAEIDISGSYNSISLPGKKIVPEVVCKNFSKKCLFTLETHISCYDFGFSNVLTVSQTS
jgi:hypothetical protein